MIKSIVFGAAVAVLLAVIIWMSRCRINMFQTGHIMNRIFCSAGLSLYEWTVRVRGTEWRTEKQKRVYRQLQYRYLKQDVEIEWKQYQGKKYGFVLAGMMLFLILGEIFIWTVETQGRELTELKRPEYGESSVAYQIEVERENGQKEDVDIVLDAQIYSEDEIQEHFELCFNELKQNILGDNQSLENIQSSLQLGDEEPYPGISAVWSSSNLDIIAVDGSINFQNAEMGENRLELYLTLRHESYSKMFQIPVVVMKTQSDAKAYLEEYFNEQEKLHRQQAYLKLPETYDKQKLLYHKKVDYSQFMGLAMLIPIGIILLIFRQKEQLVSTERKREQQLKRDYPEIISRLLILIRAGMPVRSAWIKIASDYQEQKKKQTEIHYAFEEMVLAWKEMRNGAAEGDAYLAFGKRCGQQRYLKLGSLLEQNLRKGNQSLIKLLENERMQALEERRRQIRAQGELAGSKLMMPMIILFALTMLIILVPAFLSFS